VVPAEERLQDRAQLLDARLLHARTEVEDGARGTAAGRLERPAARADEVARHREVEAPRRIRDGDLRLPAEPIGQETAAHDPHVAAGARRPAVTFHLREHVAPPLRVAERVADHLVRVVDGRTHEPPIDEAVRVEHQAILRRSR